VMRWGMSDKIGNIDYSEAHSGYQGNTGGFSVSADTPEQQFPQVVDQIATVTARLTGET